MCERFLCVCLAFGRQLSFVNVWIFCEIFFVICTLSICQALCNKVSDEEASRGDIPCPSSQRLFPRSGLSRPSASTGSRTTLHPTSTAPSAGRNTRPGSMVGPQLHHSGQCHSPCSVAVHVGFWTGKPNQVIPPAPLYTIPVTFEPEWNTVLVRVAGRAAVVLSFFSFCFLCSAIPVNVLPQGPLLHIILCWVKHLHLQHCHYARPPNCHLGA